MSVLEEIKPTILSIQKIPHINPMLAAQFSLPPAHLSLGLLTVSADHALFAAMDQGTKDSPFTSHEAGAAHNDGGDHI